MMLMARRCRSARQTRPFIGLLVLALTAGWLLTGCGNREGVVVGVVSAIGSGDPIAGAQVELGGVSTESGDDGSFRLSSVPVGEQALGVRATDHETYREEITVDPNEISVLNVRMVSLLTSEPVPSAPPEPSAVAPRAERGQPEASSIHAMRGMLVEAVLGEVQENILELFEPEGNYLDYDSAAVVVHPAVGLVAIVPVCRACPGFERMWSEQRAGAEIALLCVGQDQEELPAGYYQLRIDEDGSSVVATSPGNAGIVIGRVEAMEDGILITLPMGGVDVLYCASRASGSKGGFAVGGFSPA